MISTLTQGRCASYSFCLSELFSLLLAFAPTLLLVFFAPVKHLLRDVIDSGCLECAILFPSFSYGLMVTSDYECLCRVSTNKEHIVGEKAKKNLLKLLKSFYLLL